MLSSSRELYQTGRSVIPQAHLYPIVIARLGGAEMHFSTHAGWGVLTDRSGFIVFV